METPKMRMSSSNPNRSIPSFCKILIDQTANSLLLPPVFVKKLLLEPKFPQRPLLETHCRGKWRVKIEKNGEKYCFGEGWIEFVKDTKTEAGDFLVFILTANSTFEVSIFGPNGCEKDLTSATPKKTNCAFRGRSIIRNTNLKNVIHIDSDDDDEYKNDSDDHNEDDEDNDENENNDDYEEEEDGIDYNGGADDKNPSFELILKKSHYSTLILPKRFVLASEIQRKRAVWLRNKAGMKWQVRIGSTGGCLCLRGGWVDCWKYTKLREGDVCSFEFIPSKGDDSYIEFEVIKRVSRQKGKEKL